jgi:transcriptional regulator with XRE-family HTH domain
MRNPSKPMSGRFNDLDVSDDLAYAYRRRMGREIKAHRVQAEMTQEQLAKALGITGSAVSGMELGRVTLAPERYEEVAELFGINKLEWGKFLLRYSNPWIYALIYGHRAEDLKADLNSIPERTIRSE